MATNYYVLECETHGCDAEFWVNDVPVVRRGPEIGFYFGGPVNELILSGVNELSMVIKPGPTPSESKSGAGGVKTEFSASSEKVWARLAVYPQGATVGGPDGRELVRADWPIKDEKKKRDDFRSLPYPMVITERVELASPFGEWTWLKSPRLKLDDATRREVLQFLTELRTRFATGDPDPFIRASSIRLREVMGSYEMSPAARVNLIRSAIRQESSQPEWGFEPIEAKELDLRLVGGERMVECVRRDWKPVLAQKPDKEGNQSFYDMMLGRVDGNWQILR